MSVARLEVGFEQFEGHRSVVVRLWPNGTPRAHAIFLPAFGDEMNQSRRMMRLFAEALAARGVATCTFDPCGTGDSSAAFRDASWTRWIDDALRLEQAQSARVGERPLILFGCRLGVGLACAVSERLTRPAAGIIGWAPVLQGKAQLATMLRAARFAREQRPDRGEPNPAALWAQGRPALLGGYEVSSVLASELDAFTVRSAPAVSRVSFIELRSGTDGEPVEPSAGSRKRVEGWPESGVEVELQALAGPAFWNVADLVDVPGLIELSVRAAERMLVGFAQESVR